MIVVNVCDERGDRAQMQKRRVRFVRFYDDKLAAADAGVAAAVQKSPADNASRILSGGRQNRRQHGRHCGFAVRTGNRRAGFESQNFGEHLRARNHRRAAHASLHSFRIVVRHRAGIHNAIRIFGVFRRMPDIHARANFAKTRQ